MKNRIDHIAQQLLESDRWGWSLHLFRKGLYALLFLLALTELSVIDLFYGEGAFIPKYGYDEGLLSGTTMILNEFPAVATSFFILYAVSCAVLVFYHRWWIALICFLTHINLLNSGYLVHNSGDQLVNILLFFLIFYNMKLARNQKLINNGIVWLFRVQIALIYLVTSLYKFEGDQWPSGEALGILVENQQFNLLVPFSGSDAFLQAMTYLILLHQLAFPLVVWFARLKPSVLIIGIIVHLGIAFGVGLVDFGLIMIWSYLIFIDHEDVKRWSRFLKRTSKIFRRVRA